MWGGWGRVGVGAAWAFLGVGARRWRGLTGGFGVGGEEEGVGEEGGGEEGVGRWGWLGGPGERGTAVGRLPQYGLGRVLLRRPEGRAGKCIGMGVADERRCELLSGSTVGTTGLVIGMVRDELVGYKVAGAASNIIGKINYYPERRPLQLYNINL